MVLAAVLAAKLAMSRLFLVYRWFFFFLCFQIARSLVLMPFQPDRGRYALIFLITQPIAWLFYVFVVLEIYSLALRNHPGIASLSRWTLSAALVLSVGVSALTVQVDLSRPAGRYKALVYYSVVERGLVLSLVLFLLLITLFLVWYPVSIRRNVVLHAGVYSLYFLSSTAALFVRNVGGYQLTRAVSTVLVCVDCICFALWISWLSRRGEERLMVVRRRWRAEDEERLIRQLDALNDMLLRRPKE
jgi:hypothetical protein